ncbi:MAG: response regulator transcription factor [Chloroflexota bacterium]
MTNLIKCMLVDDHHVVRRGIKSYLESFADLSVTAEAANGEQMVDMLETIVPDVIVMDLFMPGGMDGLEATRLAKEKSPNTQVVVLTSYTDHARVVAALRAGAIGYVRKDGTPEVLLQTVRAAAQNQSVLDPTIAGAVLQDLVSGYEVSQKLTEREMDVLKLLAHGQTNKKIAASLVVSEETVKTHVGNILSKLQMNHRTSAVVLALKQGLIMLDEIDL